MKQFIVVQAQPTNGFLAHSLWFPNIAASADTKAEAIEKVCEELKEKLNASQIVSVDIPLSDSSNPIISLAGKSKDDPDFDIYLQEIERFRQEVEAKECSNFS